MHALQTVVFIYLMFTNVSPAWVDLPVMCLTDEPPVVNSTEPPTTNVVPGSYMFLFNKNIYNDASQKAQVYSSVQKILDTSNAIQLQFAFGDMTGFFVFNVSDAKLQELESKVSDYGKFIANKIYPLNYSRASQVLKPCETRGRRAASPNLPADGSNYNLDYLDRVKDGIYIRPIDSYPKIDVYVLEAGINNLADFNGRLQACYDYPSASSVSCTNNDVGFGTHVAGIIGSTTFGVTPNVNLYSIKVMPSNNQATLSTITWGYSQVQTLFSDQSRAIVYLTFPYSGKDTVIEDLTSSFISNNSNKLVFVTAANYGYSLACKNSLTSVSSVISVGSTDSGNDELPESNYGSCIDILAPAKNVRSLYTAARNLIRTNPSNAGALVTGAIAQFWQSNRNLKAAAVRASISSPPSPPQLFDDKADLLNPGTPDKLIRCTHPIPG